MRSGYFLARDLANRTARIQRDYGADVPAFVQDHLFLYAAPDKGLQLRAYADYGHRTILAYYAPGHVRAHPDRAVTVFVLSTEHAYDNFCEVHAPGECDSPFGVYLPGKSEIIVNAERGPGTLSHELMHALTSGGDFPNAPRWLGEAIASLFEQPRFTPDGGIVGETNWRLPWLTRALRAEDPNARMSALFDMSDDAFSGKLEDGGTDIMAAGMHEATARYLMQWLQDRGTAAEDAGSVTADGAWRFYREWRDGFPDDPTGRRTFERIVGHGPEQAEPDWEQWVAGL